MFTGLIEQIAAIESVDVTGAGREFRVRCETGDFEPGESVALNGACVTARETGERWFSAAAVHTTLERTTMGEWTAGRRVNLERSLRMGDRLGGHLVQGHVDGVGQVICVRRSGDALLVNVAMPPEVAATTVLHGSLAVDGVSLTVNALLALNVVQLSLIEYTLGHTTLSEMVPGRRVHLEADIIGKYVQRLIAPYAGVTMPPGS